MQVYKAIAGVAAELATVGVAKSQQNHSQGFAFRGIDDAMNRLSPIMARHNLVMLPRVVSRSVTERIKSNGTIMSHVVLEVEYTFASADDASVHRVTVYGEAMDAGDKACNKALSSAYKYAVFQSFCVPVQGTPDADATSHEVQMPEPDGFKDWLLDFETVAEDGSTAIAAAWKKSKPEFKAYAKQFHDAALRAIKARAAQVSTTVKEDA